MSGTIRTTMKIIVLWFVLVAPNYACKMENNSETSRSLTSAASRPPSNPCDNLKALMRKVTADAGAGLRGLGVGCVKSHGEGPRTRSPDQSRPGSAWRRFSSFIKRSTTLDNVDGRKEQDEQEKLETEYWNSFDNDTDPEGPFPVVHFEMSGKKVRALVDTGSGTTVIDEELARWAVGNSNDQDEILESIVMRVRIRKGRSISVTGTVMKNARFQIILGNDFNVLYKTKIKNFDEAMEISTNRGTVAIPLKWRGPSDQTSYLNSVPASLTLPLRTKVWLDDEQTHICIDTGSEFSIIRESRLKSRPTRRTNIKLYTEDKTLINFEEETDVQFNIESLKWSTSSLIARFDLADRPFLLGNAFNKEHIETIDFEEGMITFVKFGDGWVKSPIIMSQ